MAGIDTTRVDTNRMDAAVSDDKIAATEHSGSQTDNDRNWLERIPAAYWILGLLFLIMPLFASDFVLYQVFGWSFILGMISLSLMFLAGYGGMVSMAQMSIAGVAGYMVAIFGDSAITEISQGWPWYVTILLALIITALFASAIGWLAVRTDGIYTIMITLAISAALFYFTRQNYQIFNGFSGFNSVHPPDLFGVNWRSPTAFYYLTLFWAVLMYVATIYISRAPFGLALQGVRDNPRRMAALGYGVVAHRVAAYTVAAIPAGIGGILLTWQSAQISPGTIGIGPAIDVLVVAVIGGLGHPIGAFIGAFIYVILKTFSTDILIALGMSGERFRLLIGLSFLVIVFFSPDGMLGIWKRFKQWQQRDPFAASDKANDL